ncbi:glycosyltransferase family 4 protein [Ktedonobacter racemifer]|uniref:Glycosyl transferase group 1 n=1 Tax=Ktedonobacter racemifer DSM 44963 TaxID=485913 RepID=D6TD85_KTERA|nr:glycosyltransferase family 1 protein [Ktedonobacter racemifer]EFH90136.1 glycosyl transferase group 1 [Ktedonobacter racemifer DSM 44963]
MKIGINALFYQHPASGTGQYMFHLLDALSTIDSQNEYVLFGPQPASNTTSFYPYVVQPVPAFVQRNENLRKIFWEQVTAPTAARKARVDVMHVPYFAPPLLPRVPTVVTIHDVIPLRLPAYLPNKKVQAYMNLAARAAHNATEVITISQHARQDIIEVLKIPEERIHVIYQAAGEQFQPIRDPEVLARARARYGLNERYIFYLGGIDQRKNVPQLVRAFAQLYTRLGDPDLQLFISGNPDKQSGPFFPDPRPVARELGIEKQVICRFVEDEDKPTIYSGARLFAFPSLYEGFGLDPLEAMGCGTPVVCSNRTSLPEVVGDAALLIDPDNLNEFVDAMYRVLTDETLRSDLSARSLERAKAFSWHTTATQTLSVYEQAYRRTHTHLKK